MQKSFSIKEALSYGFRTFFGHLGLFLSALGLYALIYVGKQLIGNVITRFFFGRLIFTFSSIAIGDLPALVHLALSYYVGGVPDKLLVLGLIVFYITIGSFFYGLYQINLDLYKTHASSAFRLLLSKSILVSLFPLAVLDVIAMTFGVKLSWGVIFNMNDFTWLPIALVVPFFVIIINFAIIRVIELNGHLIEALKYSFHLVKGAIAKLIAFSFIALWPMLFIQQIIVLQILPRLVGAPLSFASFEEVQASRDVIKYMDQVTNGFNILWMIPEGLWMIIMFASTVFVYKKLQEQTT